MESLGLCIGWERPKGIRPSGRLGVAGDGPGVASQGPSRTGKRRHFAKGASGEGQPSRGGHQEGQESDLAKIRS